MKILVTGGSGQLGADVRRCLDERKIENVCPCRADMDLTDIESIIKTFERKMPDAVIHCAAYTAVDRAESEPEVCRKVNAEATRCIALECAKHNIPMMYISTDYVFSGEGEEFFETDSAAAPLGVYGKTKLEGENYVRKLLEKYFIVRVSWTFGCSGKNFVKTMINLGRTKEQLNVVADQYGSPTYTKHLANLICDMIVTDRYGTYHATSEGICTWADFAEAIMDEIGSSTKINRITTEEYGAAAARPKNSRLSKKSLDEAGFTRLPEWQQGLKEFICELKSKGDF